MGLDEEDEDLGDEEDCEEMKEDACEEVKVADCEGEFDEGGEMMGEKGEIGLDDEKKTRVAETKIIKLQRKKADLVDWSLKMVKTPIKLERKGNDIMEKLLAW